MQAMGNCLLSNCESVCKFFLVLSRIFLQELLQFLVFDFFRLTASFSVGKVKITIAKCPEQLFTRFMYHRNYFGCLSWFFFNSETKRMRCLKCFLSGAIIFTYDFWGPFRKAATYYSVFWNLRFTLWYHLKAGKKSFLTKSYKTSQ